MKKAALIAAIFLIAVLPMNINAQDQKGKRPARPSKEQVIEHQYNVAIRELMLDDEKAAKFKTVFTAYQEDFFAIHKKYMPGKKKGKKGANESDAEIEKRILNKFAMSREIIDVREKYYNQFRQFLTPRQIEKIFDLEKDKYDGFRKESNRRKK